MTDNIPEYVWYASFGSNLAEDRFLCYIKGGKPPGSSKIEKGARDQSMPLDMKAIELPFSLYFSGYSERWGGGVAFIGLTKQESKKTLGRMYLITKQQFVDVVNQENGLDESDINLSDVIKNQSFVMKESLYGNLLHVGNEASVPIFTFTYFKDQHDQEVTSPSKSYLTMLIKGYKETYTYKDEQIIEYLIDKPGVKDNWSHLELSQLVASI